MPLDKKIELTLDIVKAIALLVSGLWAAWTFQKLQKVRAANLDIIERNSNLRKSKIEQQASRAKLLSQQPQLKVDLLLSEETSRSGESLLSVSVALTNQGEQNLMAMFDTDALTIATGATAADGTPSIQVILRTCPFSVSKENDKPQMMRERVFRIGQTRRMAITLLPISEHSTFWIQFRTIYYKIPFDGEKAPSEERVYINAIEQAFYVSPARTPMGRAEIVGEILH